MLIRASLFCLTIALAASAKAQTVTGEQLFKQRCSSCHAVNAKDGPRIGPNMAGVIGRKAGTTAFPTYSAALKKSGLTWTETTVAAFLAGPTKVVPGTRMVVALPDAAQRQAIVKYLATRK